MPSSELSDALNPHVAHARHTYSTPALPPSKPYISTQSELGIAISDPPRSRPNPSPGAINAVQELVSLVASTKQAQEIERTRRLAWEQEQEAKYIQRQAEMERQMLEMRSEISTLRSIINATHSPLFTPHNGSPAIANLRHPRPATPISPVSQPSSHSQQSVQGSSRLQPPYYTNDSINALNHALEFPPRAATRSPSRNDSETESSVSRRRRKRRRFAPSSGDETGSASDSSSCPPAQRRTDHHDKRLLTVQSAMRAHIILLMDLPNDKDLPDSHMEGEPLEPPNPVRFVWEKTTKQSAHNGRMKLRVLEDFRARRRLYKHVPDKEFSKKVVDSTFEQSFTTYRQKFRTQRDMLAASRLKQREDTKARKSRHVARRKTKLSNRADARIKLNTFEHATFDGAMQTECMSSEESDFDTDMDISTTPRGSRPLRTRGYAWRSSRLLRFYAILDAEDSADANTRPKRGLGRRERFKGPHKEGLQLPPKGVASWMISRRWLVTAHPDLGIQLKTIVSDAPGIDWARLSELGGETDDDERTVRQPLVPHYTTCTSSLHCALA
ncbi:hypothetical protein B0H15DRAFT_969605 [Mycena belliarum]|uniref:Uncharacterized protein n=1 Tax=Mycena belliarum TaxID=1033014 RepID=A0AAD6U9H7_9AGAR|nr:hypothetical protein B0H15DRAFT_969605 [Mycena belliae]